MSSSSSVALDAGIGRRAPGTPPLARTIARLRAHALDRRIARGADPAAGPVLSARAAVLVSRPARDEAAGDLERILVLAQRGELRRLGAVPIRRHEVIAAADALRDLVELLRAPRAIPPRSVALARGLVRDGTTPVYAPAPRGAVRRVARQALGHAERRFVR